MAGKGHHERQGGEGHGEEQGEEGGGEDQALRAPEGEEPPRLVAPRRRQQPEVLLLRACGAAPRGGVGGRGGLRCAYGSAHGERWTVVVIANHAIVRQ